MKATTILLTAAVAVLTACFLTGCVTNPGAFEDNGNYVTGDLKTESAVKALEIEWTAGNVTVLAAEQSEVSVTETCNVTLNEDQRMQTWLDGTTLHVRYCKPSVHFNLTDAVKTLEIRLPKQMLDSLAYEGTSADAAFTDVAATRFEAEATAGNLVLRGCTAEQFDLNTTSGDMTLETDAPAESLHAESTDGAITLTADAVKTLTVTCTSGDSEISVQQAETVKLESTSGKKALRCAEMPKETKITATSGDVTLTLPQNADFTASVETTSGDFNSAIALSKKGDSYVSGSGENSLTVSTTAGNVEILAAE